VRLFAQVASNKLLALLRREFVCEQIQAIEATLYAFVTVVLADVSGYPDNATANRLYRCSDIRKIKTNFIKKRLMFLLIWSSLSSSRNGCDKVGPLYW
jgi:hypothetical protein